MLMSKIKKVSTTWSMALLAVLCMVISSGWSEENWMTKIVTPSEMQQKEQWVKNNLLKAKAQMPFSFIYDGKEANALLSSWPIKTETNKLNDNKTQFSFIWTDAKTGLEVRCTAVKYSDFPVIEWTVYFKNTGKEDTPVLEKIQGLDAQFQRGDKGEFVLHHWRGDTSDENLYQPLELTLAPNAKQSFAPNGGRGTNGVFPYYNLAMSDGGVMIAVGWPGQWATSFTRDAKQGLHITAGQELTHLILKPGEQVRTPLIALVFWKDKDIASAQNLWRHWMWAHNVPRTKEGKLPCTTLFGNTSGEFNEMINANEENQKHFLDRYKEERIDINYWWMDAGWYPCDGNWPKTGTWEPDTKRFPAGLRAISDHALKNNVKTLVWFEPERVAADTWISKNHPDWLLGNTLLNLGKPEVLKWLTDHVDQVLTEQGIHLYRQDFNMDPLDYWRKNDAPDRQGITENLHIQNYLAYWDALRERHPDLLIDSCASGGRRNDLETMRRAVPLHPTDYNYGNLPVKQAFHYSLFQWIPFFGSNTVPVDTVTTYAFRSGHAMGVVLGYDFRNKDLNYELLRKLTSEWKQINAFYYCDYYPLTPYSIDDEQWIAWQFDNPKGAGIVEAFRRVKNKETTKVLRLSGLDPAANYDVFELSNLDKDINTIMSSKDLKADKTLSGKELMEKGLSVDIKEAPGTGLILYKKK